MVATEQVRSFLGRSYEEGIAASSLFVFDAGYDPVKVQQGLEGCSCQILVRLRAGQRFYGDPSLCDPPENIGRPRRHGPKMKCSDPSTWPEPSAEHRCEDAGYGAVRVRAWAKMHPKVHNHAGRGTRGPLPIVVGTLILVEVERRELEIALDIVPVASVQNRYNLSERSSEAVVQACEREGAGFIPWYPLATGRLSRPSGSLEEVARRHGATPSQVALAWLLGHSPAMLPIPGTSSVAHLEENVAAAKLELTDEEIAMLEGS